MEGGSLKVGVYVCRSRTNAEVYCHVPAMKHEAGRVGASAVGGVALRGSKPRLP